METGPCGIMPVTLHWMGENTEKQYLVDEEVEVSPTCKFCRLVGKFGDPSFPNWSTQQQMETEYTKAWIKFTPKNRQKI
jgi:hypothetical protein